MGTSKFVVHPYLCFHLGDEPNRNFLPDSPTDIRHDNFGSALHRFRRYAAWMHRLFLIEEDERWMSDDTFGSLLTDSMASGVVCPTLRSLTCHLTKANSRFLPYLISPHLTHLIIYVRPSRYNPRSPSPDLGPIIQALPTPFLQEVSIKLGLNEMNHFKDQIVSMVQRCGHSMSTLG